MTFTYDCKKCEQRFDYLVLFDEVPPAKHNEADTHSDCDGELEKRIGAPLAVFKGGGFHSTDYPSK